VLEDRRRRRPRTAREREWHVPPSPQRLAISVRDQSHSSSFIGNHAGGTTEKAGKDLVNQNDRALEEKKQPKARREVRPSPIIALSLYRRLSQGSQAQGYHLHQRTSSPISSCSRVLTLETSMSATLSPTSYPIPRHRAASECRSVSLTRSYHSYSTVRRTRKA